MRRPPTLGLSALALLAAAGAASAQSGLGTIRFDNWGFFQKNTDDSNQWQYRPRVYIPFGFGDGWTFTQRADLPMLYTNKSGPGNPGGDYSGGLGDALIEEIFETPEVAKNLTLRASVRFVFPTGKQSPFGASQYQWAPGVGFTYRMPDTLNGVTIAPYVRYFRGFDPQYTGVTPVSSLNLFPAATFSLNERWSLAFYPENPITYNYNTHTWFVPLDFMLVNRVSKGFEFAFGGAFRLANTSNPTYRYLVDARLTFYF